MVTCAACHLDHQADELHLCDGGDWDPHGVTVCASCGYEVIPAVHGDHLAGCRPGVVVPW